MNGEILPRSFYERDTIAVARDVLGKCVVRATAERLVSGRIVEAEAYLTGDPASHSFRGPTARNAAMFGPAGHAYVYFSYGMHFMFNIVTADVNCGEAVLVRALEPLQGLETMRRNSGSSAKSRDNRLCAGPGRLARALGITRPQFDGVDLTNVGSGLYLIDAPAPDAADVVAAKRIGITKAADRLWRFYLRSSPSVSRR